MVHEMVYLRLLERPETRINTGFYLSNDFIVGNTQEEKVLFLIIKYYQVFVVFLKRIITYYSVPFIPTS